MNLSAMLFNVPILIGLFSCQGVGWCKELTLSNNRFFMNFLLLTHIGPHWQQLYYTLVACFSCLLQCNRLLLFLFFGWGGGSGSVNCTRFPNLKISVALQSKIYQ